ncbi:unnamed protein product [Microthlaspi erraticum]|uniref:Uncharacterized protein n=1 Tax=Microthlaspi erraticum TaxID=1685480 RepID=A0A6D2HTX3_9BRAS|nr:unnamed protein product [Microthlaspi erraticum]
MERLRSIDAWRAWEVDRGCKQMMGSIELASLLWDRSSYVKAARPNLARSAPALGLNCADWASKTASGRPRRSDGRSGRSAGQSGLGRVGTVVAGCFTVGRCGRTDEDLADGFSAGRGTFFPARTDASAVVREMVARPRGFSRLARHGRARRGVALWLGRPRAVSRVVMRDRPTVWTLAETSVGRTFWPSAEHSFLGQPDCAVRALILDRAVWSSLHSFGYNSFSTHPNEAVPVALES